MTVTQNACSLAHPDDGLISGVWASRLRKPWECITKIAELKNLESQKDGEQLWT